MKIKSKSLPRPGGNSSLALQTDQDLWQWVGNILQRGTALVPVPVYCICTGLKRNNF
jgi:hypothetical protein